jgi:hypothetical protein
MFSVFRHIGLLWAKGLKKFSNWGMSIWQAMPLTLGLERYKHEKLESLSS